jgi:glycosyltransferase involved in cell wall biosynthesis
MAPFKIHTICVVKNEGDIIEECLKAASKWSDYIYVYDGQSTDGTWEKVVAMQNEQIVPWKQDGKTFQESLRAEVYNAFKDRARDGDWWCHLDADEFPVQNPKEFLAGVPSAFHVVWAAMIEYYLTQKDVDSFDFELPTAQLLAQLRYYKAEHAEPRFVKHRDKMVWHENEGWPRHMGLVHPERILYKHFKYRSPQQIQTRLDTRRKNIEGGFTGWQHARQESWEQTIADVSQLQFDKNDGNFALDESRLPQHLEPAAQRLIKRIMHGTRLWP